jgi:Phosphopantetheine attachment site.
MTTFETITSVIERVTGIPAASITPATTFVDVSADSLDHVEIFLEVEREFDDIDLDQDALDLVGTFGQLADLVDRAIADRAQARAA